MPGGGVALNSLGVAVVGLATLNDMVASATAIAKCVNVPVIADADTGFGHVLNVQRTVQEYERAGIAAIHIEDQQFPKRCGHLDGKNLVSVGEAAQRIRAAVDAKRDPQFMVIARCDALSVEGIDAAVHRGKAYLDAGADMLFIESLRSQEDIADIPKRLPALHLFNMNSGGKAPPMTADELGRLGYQLMIFPNFMALAAIKAMSDVLEKIHRSKSVANVLDQCAGFAQFTALGGLEQLLKPKSAIRCGKPI